MTTDEKIHKLPRADAKLYGVVVEVRPTERHSWRDIRDEQNARTLTTRDAIDAFIAKAQAAGLLKLTERHGRKYSY